MRILVKGFLDFLQFCCGTLKPKKLSLSGTKVLGTVRDFCGEVKKLGTEGEINRTEFGLSLVLLIPDSNHKGFSYRDLFS